MSIRFVDADDLFKIGVIPDKVVMEDTETGQRVEYVPIPGWPDDYINDGVVENEAGEHGE